MLIAIGFYVTLHDKWAALQNVAELSDFKVWQNNRLMKAKLYRSIGSKHGTNK